MKITAPWTDAQVAALNRWQKDGGFHEFSCPQHHMGDRALVAERDGWKCQECGYRQTWAHDFMAVTA